jgi:hypothetical protein
MGWDHRYVMGYAKLTPATKSSPCRRKMPSPRRFAESRREKSPRQANCFVDILSGFLQKLLPIDVCCLIHHSAKPDNFATKPALTRFCQLA